MSIKSFFNKIAKKYVGEHGYEEMLSVPSLQKFLTHLPKGAKILDVGCGGGQDTKFLKDNGCDVVGIDMSKEMINIAKEHNPGIQFEIMDFMKYNPEGKFDGVWCSRVFHLMTNIGPDNFFGQVKKVLKKDGILYITSLPSSTDGEIIKNHLVVQGLTENSFKSIILSHNFEILDFRYWEEDKGMEIIAKEL